LSVPEVILDAIGSMQLSSPPHVLLRFLHLVKDEQCSTADLALLVSHDPALCAHVLSVANSRFLQRGNGSARILQCLVNLGSEYIRTLASSLVVHDVFSQPERTQQYDVTGFWGHSLRMAEMSRLIAVAVNYPDIEEAYLCGLLHDAGQLLLLGGMGDRYGTLLELSLDESILHAMETRKLGTDHTEVGAWLVDQWNLPSFMADSILFHHKTAEEIVSADQLSRILWAAHAICTHNQPETPVVQNAQPGSLETAHIISDHYKLLGLAQKVRTPDLDAVQAMFGIDSAKSHEIYQQACQRVAAIAAEYGISEPVDSKPFPRKANLPLESFRIRLNEGNQADAQLEAAVRDMAMMQSLQQDFAQVTGDDDVFHAIRASARILFGQEKIVFLLKHPDRHALCGADLAGQPVQLKQIEIPLDTGHSLAAEAALEKQPRSTFGPEPPKACSLADIQLSRALGSDGILYLPLHTQKGSLGVMAFGICAAQSARHQKNLAWLSSFARIAAESIEKARDMRERERTLETLLTKRFEQQARKVIHEAGNPLSIINNYLAIVRRKLPEQSIMQQELDILREEIGRVSEIVQNMGTVTEKVLPIAALDVNSLIESMLVMYGDSLFYNRGIKVETLLDPRMATISGSRDSVKQILVNLWNNASDAMQQGGSLSISTDGDVNQNGRSYIEIRVSDTGPGLPQDVLKNLYQPLPHDRRAGHSGVGLSIVASLVEQLDGRITCQTRPGRGTSFSILLPQFSREEK